MHGRAPIGVAVTGLALVEIARYGRDLPRDRERLAALERRVIDAPVERVEYAQTPAVAQGGR
jgi:hypothetical protein